MSISCRTNCICPPGAKHKCTERREDILHLFRPVAGLIIAGEVVKDLCAGSDRTTFSENGNEPVYIRHAAKKVQEKCRKEVARWKQIFMFWRFKYVWTGSATTDRYGWGVRWTSIINEKLGLQEYRVIRKDFAAGQRYLTTRSAKADGNTVVSDTA